MSQKGGKQPPSPTAPAPGVMLLYTSTTGRTPVEEYLDDLGKRDVKARQIIGASLAIIDSKGYIYEPGGGAVRLEGANIHQLDKDKHTKGHRLSEILYHGGSGQRVYMLEHDGHVVILDGARKPAPNKQTQDIENAARKATDWVNRYERGEFTKEIAAKRIAMAPPPKVTPIQGESSPGKAVPVEKGFTPPESKPTSVPEKPGGAASDWRARLAAHNAEKHARQKAAGKGGWRGAVAGLVAAVLVTIGLGKEQEAEAQELPVQPTPETPASPLPASAPPASSPSGAALAIPPHRAFQTASARPALMQESVPAVSAPQTFKPKAGSPAGPQ